MPQHKRGTPKTAKFKNTRPVSQGVMTFHFRGVELRSHRIARPPLVCGCPVPPRMEITGPAPPPPLPRPHPRRYPPPLPPPPSLTIPPPDLFNPGLPRGCARYCTMRCCPKSFLILLNNEFPEFNNGTPEAIYGGRSSRIAVAARGTFSEERFGRRVVGGM